MFGMGGGGDETIEVAVQATGVDAFEQELDRAANKAIGFEKAIAGVGVAAAGAAVAGLGASVSAAGDFDAAMTQSIAIMDDVDNAMRSKMMDTAREVATSTVHSHEEAAESYFFLASAGMDAEQSMAALPQVAAFAQAGMFDMATATDLATDAQSALGLTSEDAEKNLENLTRVTDVLVGANTLANASVEQFSESLTNKAGSALKNTNKDIEEGVAVLAAYADQGVKGRLAGERLNIVIRDLQKAALENGEAFDELGISVYDSEGNMRNMADIIADVEKATEGMSTEQQNAALSSLGLSQQAADGIAPLIGQSEAIRDYEGDLRSAGGTVDEIAGNQMQSFNQQWDLTKDKIRDVGITIGSALLPYLTSLLENVTPLIDRFSEWIEEGNELKVVTGVLVGAVAALVPAISLAAQTVGPVISGFLSLSSAIAFLTNPITIVMGAIVGLALAWETNFAGIREFTESVLSVVEERFGPIVQRIFDNVSGFLNEFGGSWDETFGGIEETVITFLEFIEPYLIEGINAVADGILWVLDFVEELWNTHAADVAEVVVGYVTTVTEAITGLVGVILELLGPFFERAGEFWASHGEEVEFIVTTLAHVLIELVTWLVDGLETIVSTFITVGSALWSKFGDELITVAEFFADAIFGIFGWLIDAISTALEVALALWEGDWEGAWDTIETFFVDTLEGMYDFFTGWGSRFYDYMSGLFGDAKDAVVDAATEAKDGAVGKFEDLKSDIKDLVDDMLEVLTGSGKRFKDAGKGLIKAFTKGIKNSAKSAVTSPKKAVKNAFGKIRDLLPSSDAKEGPLSDLTKSGKALTETFIKGIDKGPDIKSFTESLLPDPRAAVKAAASGSGGGTNYEGDTYHVTVNANGYESGRAAGRGFLNEMRSRNVHKRGY